MSHHKNILDFQLVRKKRAPLPASSFEFMVPFVGSISPGDWEIWDIHDKKSDSFLHRYAVCIPQQAYVILNAELVDDEPPYTRLTEMRLWQIIEDNWAAAAGKIKLHWVGVHCIIDKACRTAILQEFAFQTHEGKADTETTQLTITADTSVSWSYNTFIRCVCHVVEDPTRLKAHYVRDSSDEDAEMSMVLGMMSAEI